MSRLKRSLGASALVVAVIIGIVTIRMRSALGGRNIWLEADARRPLEARISLPAADQHRPAPPNKLGAESNALAPLPNKLLAGLEQPGKEYELAVAYLVRHRPKDALLYLAKLASTPTVDNEQAVALLELHKYDEALQSLERVLDANPNHPQALWNRALVLRELGLPLAAAKMFQAVADLKEPGWAEEAAANAQALSAPVRYAEARWTEFKAACQVMIETGKVSDVLNRQSPPVLRHYFYEAVYASPTPERVRGLLPLAQELDRVSGGTVLTDYANRVAARDFSKRRALAEVFLKSWEHPTQQPDATQLVESARRSGEEDLLLGAIMRGWLTQENLDDLRRLASSSRDPWFQALAFQEDARAARAKKDASEARSLFEQAIRLSRQHHLFYRWMHAESHYVDALTGFYQLDDAWVHATDILQQARTTHEWDMEADALEHLSEVATFRRSPALARAHLEEELERVPTGPRRQAYIRYIYTNLARLERDRLRFAAAREAIDRAMATRLPLSLSGASVLGDIVRYKLNPGDEAAILDAIGGDGKGLTAGERLLRKHALGRFYLTQSPPKGRALLEEVVRETDPEHAADDAYARKARAYSFAYLVMEHGKEGENDAALRLLAEELGAEVPARCTVAIAEETERTLWIVRGLDGTTQGHYDGRRREPWPDNLSGVLPRSALNALERCEHVIVFAHPPLYGRAGLLPPEIAWSYRLAGARPPASPTAPPMTRLVVTDVQLDERRDLPKVAPWPTEEKGVSYLRGSQATPTRVLEEMQTASEIVVVTHGEVRSQSGSTALVLAPGPDGRDELTTEDVRQTRLRGAPLVTLIACSAGRAAPALHEPYSMPAALIEAGARGVIAATVEIPDRNAYDFFTAVHERIRRGAPPAAALRDERVKRLDDTQTQNANGWIRNVLLFD